MHLKSRGAKIVVYSVGAFYHKEKATFSNMKCARREKGFPNVTFTILNC